LIAVHTDARRRGTDERIDDATGSVTPGSPPPSPSSVPSSCSRSSTTRRRSAGSSGSPTIGTRTTP